MSNLYCPNCGTENASGARFCNACGASLAASPKCRNCGADIVPGVAFCSACGYRLAQAPPPKTQTSKGEPQKEPGKGTFNQFLNAFVGQNPNPAPTPQGGPDDVEYVSAEEFFAQQYAEKQAREQSANPQQQVSPPETRPTQQPIHEQPQQPMPQAPVRDVPPPEPHPGQVQPGQEHIQTSPPQSAPQASFQSPAPGGTHTGQPHAGVPGQEPAPFDAPTGQPQACAWGTPPPGWGAAHHTGGVQPNGQPMPGAGQAPGGWGGQQPMWNYSPQAQAPQWAPPEAQQTGWAPNPGAWSNNGIPTGWTPPSAPAGQGADNYEDEDEDEENDHVSPMDYLAQRQSKKGKLKRNTRSKAPSAENNKRKKFQELANVDGYYNDRRPLDNEEDLEAGRNIAWVPLILGIIGIGLFAFLAIQLQGLL